MGATGESVGSGGPLSEDCDLFYHRYHLTRREQEIPHFCKQCRLV